MSDNTVDLKFQLGVEEIGQGAGVDERRGPADEQNATGIRVRQVRLLGGLDAVPHDAGIVSLDAKAIQLTLREELVGDLALEEHHLRRTTRVVALNLRAIDVNGKDAAKGAQLVNRRQKLVRGQIWWEVDDEERAVEIVSNVLTLIGRKEDVALVVRAEMATDSGNGTSCGIIETYLPHRRGQIVQDAG